VGGRFENKVVIITGAGKGVGSTAARGFAREGASVVVADVDDPAGREVARQIGETGGQALFVHCNVSRSSDVQAMVLQTVSAFGGVDILYNNAGIVKYDTVVDQPEEDWDQILNVNLKGSFLTCKYAIPEMRKRGGGAIVNTASVQAFASQKTVAAYSASKAAIVGFTRTVALDHASEGIRCNCIAPGSIQTPMLDQSARTFYPDNPQGAFDIWGQAHPLGRVGRPEEVAEFVMFLAGDTASFCTGGCYLIDGGLLAGAL
jgi:NAD(P)-dependent dehydrogenase (short-subunit alcohol dehydrogenase family)